MADVRVQQPVKIVDPATDADAAGVIALADNVTNPTGLLGALTTGAFLMGWDTSTWDRVQIGGGTEAAALRTSEATDSNLTTAVELIDDAIFVDDTATHATGTTVGMGIMAVAVPTDTAIEANDIGMPAMSLDRRLHTDTDITASVTLTVTDDGNFNLAASDGIDIGDVDVTSILPGTGALNLGKIEDALHTTGDVGVMMLGVENEDQAALTAGDKDYTPIAVTAAGNVEVTIRAATLDVALGTDISDVFGAASLIEAGVLGEGVATSTDVLNVRNFNYVFNGSTFDFMREGGEAGSILVDMGANNDITGSVDIITSMVPGTAATHLGKAEDAAHSDLDTGVGMLAVRRDTASTMVTADNDYTFLTVDANGRLHVADPNAGAGSPSTPTIDYASATLAAGVASTTEFRTVDVGADTFRLAGVDISSSVAFKGQINIVDNDAVTIQAVVWGQAGGTVQWRAAHKDYHAKTWAGSAGFDGFEVLVTNNDTSESADFYVAMYYED